MSVKMDLSSIQVFLLALPVLASKVIELQGYHRFGLKSKDDQKNSVYQHIFY